ncbi:hypothetical protein GOP47_0007393 [Adiantum capillus-veneris]|uniref:40S ribosomal protein S4 n=1 Tax=Adiantum capillus-veneris TaxID=13818 RepID=A0A9D4V0X8_ADICA|nr:hypothetical protein GOP47_0007393 [Adiantum capillus-veneris]
MLGSLKKHLKHLNSPRHSMLDTAASKLVMDPYPLKRVCVSLVPPKICAGSSSSLGGDFAPKPSAGPHKTRECLPMVVSLRNRLKYTLTYREVVAIALQRLISLDGNVRMDKCYLAGFMDVVSIAKTGENFHLLYDSKGRFTLHSTSVEESKYKLCKVRDASFGEKEIPNITTFDRCTIRNPDPLIKANDTIKIEIKTGKHHEKHKGSFEVVHVQDAIGQVLATPLGNVFTIGKGSKPWMTLPRGKGIKLFIVEEAKKKEGALKGAVA